jgi:hypothetical protein
MLLVAVSVAGDALDSWTQYTFPPQTDLVLMWYNGIKNIEKDTISSRSFRCHRKRM